MRHKLNSILLIDDDHLSNSFSRILLEEVACTNHINTTHTGEDALKYIVDSAQPTGHVAAMPFPDLIFLDINMPAMNGWEFLDEYRKLEHSFWQTPVIVMLTSAPDDANKSRVLNLPDVVDVYNKPMTTAVINEVFNKYFPDYV